jgi:MFS family permease
MDLISILLVTPISDRFHHHRALFFSISVLLQILGLLLTTFSGSDTNSWPRYGGLLIVGFGLGPTVPITMTWTAEIFQARHGELGVAAATALISGLGNLGSVVTTYALYAGWPADYEAKGRAQYRNSNLVMVAIAAASILAALTMEVCLRTTQTTPAAIHATGIVDQNDNMIEDGAAKRESQQRGLKGLFPRHNK